MVAPNLEWANGHGHSTTQTLYRLPDLAFCTLLHSPSPNPFLINWTKCTTSPLAVPDLIGMQGQVPQTTECHKQQFYSNVRLKNNINKY